MSGIFVDGINYCMGGNENLYFSPHPLELSSTSSSAAILLALLIGGMRIFDSKLEAKQSKNFMILGGPAASLFYSKNLENAFTDLREDINGKLYFSNAKATIKRYLKDQRSNHSLFSPLLNEISRLLLKNNNDQGLAGFVHSYRALESASYTFPLFYCRYEKVYMKAYDKLKEFFKGGELEFCNNFFAFLLKDDDMLGVPMEIEFVGPYKEDYANLMMSHLSWVIDKKNDTKSISRTGVNTVSLDFEHCFDLIVRLRNQFFHHLSGSNSSISSSQIKDADEFFKPINELAVQVLAYMYGKIIRIHI